MRLFSPLRYGILILVCLLQSSCVIHRPYRTDRFGTDKTQLHSTVIEEDTNRTLAFIEMDDQGWLWNDEQLNAISRKLKEDLDQGGVLLLVYVHGWKHNAGPDDSNVRMFKDVLGELAAVSQTETNGLASPSRKVFGVYVGWPGLVEAVEPFKEISFWKRKEAAERVGRGGVVDILCTLEAIQYQNNKKHAEEIAAHKRLSTKLVVFGHSFGADVVFSALSPLILERLVDTASEDSSPGLPIRAESTMVLINPAFEAARFETIDSFVKNSAFAAPNRSMLAVFTSKTDRATGWLFPAARFLTNPFRNKANLLSVGHYDPYITHDLNPLKDPSSVQQSGTTKFSESLLQARTNYVANSPVFNVSVDSSIIPDHDTITNRVFIGFLKEFITRFSN